MIDTFDRDGIRFPYPGNWRPDPEAVDDGGAGWTIVLQSPGAAFLLVSLRPEADNPAELADQTLDALKAEYQELDAEDVIETLAGRVAIGHDIDFLTLDTTVACLTRSVDTPAGPLLLMGQASEYEKATAEPVFRAVFASLVVEPD